MCAPKEMTAGDVVVAMERDVAAHHVVEQDAQGPHRRGSTHVPVL